MRRGTVEVSLNSLWQKAWDFFFFILTCCRLFFNCLLFFMSAMHSDNMTEQFQNLIKGICDKLEFVIFHCIVLPKGYFLITNDMDMAEILSEYQLTFSLRTRHRGPVKKYFWPIQQSQQKQTIFL